jgi:rifampin ADP-ribosylating transferase
VSTSDNNPSRNARARRRGSAVRGSHLIVYDDSGHLVLWERPERVANDLTEFVQACPPDRGPGNAGSPFGSKCPALI